MIDIEKIEQVYQKATAGEWIADHVSSEGPYKLHSVQPRVCDVFYQTEKGAATADCIALLHNAWPQIRRELEAGRKLIAHLLDQPPCGLTELQDKSRTSWTKENWLLKYNELKAQFDRSGT